MMNLMRVVFVGALLALLGAAQVSGMQKKSRQQRGNSARSTERRTPVLGPTGPFGSVAWDLGKGIETENESATSEIVGHLSLFVVRDPKLFFEGLKEPDHYLDIDLRGDEWGALFYDVLKCPKATIEPFSPGEDVEHWRERYKLKFQDAVTDYAMLSRIWDLYVYINYRPEEIAQLRQECLRVQTSTSNEKALRALGKLVAACDEASKLGSGLLLVPD